jgi:predicted HAD superfamily Cof-like phosphohydrolase
MNITTNYAQNNQYINTMKTKLFSDLQAFHEKFEFNKDWEPTVHNLRQRLDVMIREELDEGLIAIEERDTVGLIDALIDLIYFAVGTLDLMKVNGDAHWDAVQSANMEKVRGSKASRPNTNGLDVIKPEGWVAPEPRHRKILETTPFEFKD